MNLKIMILVIGFLSLVGCASTPTVHPDYIKVDGKIFSRDADGSVALTADEIEMLRSHRDVTIVERVLPDGGMAITAAELNLLSKDAQLFTESLNGIITDNEVFSFLVKKGSLKENLERLCAKFSTGEDTISLSFEVTDFYVNESKIIRANSLSSLIKPLVSAYPVFSSIH